MEAIGGVRARTGLRAEEGENVDITGGLGGSVFTSGELSELTGFRRGEPGPSFRMKRPAVATPGVKGGDCIGEVVVELAG